MWHGYEEHYTTIDEKPLKTYYRHNKIFKNQYFRKTHNTLKFVVAFINLETTHAFIFFENSLCIQDLVHTLNSFCNWTPYIKESLICCNQDLNELKHKFLYPPSFLYCSLLSSLPTLYSISVWYQSKPFSFHPHFPLFNPLSEAPQDSLENPPNLIFINV